MADLPERDAALLLDMLLAARDARSFIKGLNEAAFLASRLHQNAVIRSLEVLVSRDTVILTGRSRLSWRVQHLPARRVVHALPSAVLEVSAVPAVSARPSCDPEKPRPLSVGPSHPARRSRTG
jgi:hypothetical protein